MSIGDDDITPVTENGMLVRYLVQSQSKPGTPPHIVSPEGKCCSCQAFLRSKICKHTCAVLLMLATDEVRFYDIVFCFCTPHCDKL